jgi:hypothetical protein
VKKQKFERGASRSFTKDRHDLVTPEGSEAAAQRFGLGVALHGENNWKRGGREFIKGIINHLKAHTGTLVMNEGNGDDDVGAILWAGHTLAWFRKHKSAEYRAALRELNKG